MLTELALTVLVQSAAPAPNVMLAKMCILPNSIAASSFCDGYTLAVYDRIKEKGDTQVWPDACKSRIKSLGFQELRRRISDHIAAAQAKGRSQLDFPLSWTIESAIHVVGECGRFER